jgi:hypothetical protein
LNLYNATGPDDPGMPVAPMKKRSKKEGKPCFMFRDGNCKYGDACRYSHDEGGSQKAEHEDSYLIGSCLLRKFTPDEKLKNISNLPERLKKRARTIFFAKSKLGHFEGHGTQELQGESREGDWNCPSCHKTVYASKWECFSCGIYPTCARLFPLCVLQAFSCSFCGLSPLFLIKIGTPWQNDGVMT